MTRPPRPATPDAPIVHALIHELQALDQAHDEQTLRTLAQLVGPHTPGRSAELLDVARAAELLHVHPDTLVRWARSKRIWAIKVGREWRFDPDRLEVTPVTGRTAASPAPSTSRRHPPRGTFRAVDALRALG